MLRYLPIFAVFMFGLVGAGDLPFACTSKGLWSTESADLSSSSLAISSRLPDIPGYLYTCLVTAGSADTLLRVRVKKRALLPGSLHVNIYAPPHWENTGHLTTPHTGFLYPSQKYICLPTPPSLGTHTQRYVTFSGTPGLEFTADIDTAKNTLQLGKTVNFTISRYSEVIFQYTPDFDDHQLAITTYSEDEPSASEDAFLAVSSFCHRVTREEHNVISKTEPLMFLTFQKQGRIVLSKVSRPRVQQNNTIYIGVYMTTKNNETKSVKIVLHKTFSYDYTTPMCSLFFVSLFGGIFVAVWALLCFREPLTLIDDAAMLSTSTLEISSRARWKGALCGNTENSGELEPLIRTPRSTGHGVLSAMLKVLKYHWLGFGPKTFSYITCIVGSVLLIGAFQFVYENWFLMSVEGNRDKCFYNEFCYRVSTLTNIPFNLMISNLAYMIHGLILALSVLVMEAELYVQAEKTAEVETAGGASREAPPGREALPHHTLVCPCPEAHLPQLTVPRYELSSRQLASRLYARAYKRKYCFTIGYAFAWALLFEGFFSLTYHLCPTKVTFQFDSAFMLVIAGLIMLSLYNGFFAKRCPVEEGISNPIEATVFFLVAIVPLFALNYLGSVYKQDRQTGTTPEDRRLPDWVKVLFILVLITWCIFMFIWALLKLFYTSFRNGTIFATNENIVKVVIFCLAVIVSCVLCPILFLPDISNMFLFGAIAASMFSVVGKIIIKFGYSYIHFMTSPRRVLRVFQALYIVVFLATMATALYMFLGVPTSDKTLSPAKSRNLNKECTLFGFFGAHDIWHILSSFALLMGAFLVIFISE
ncbi:uncharacterized protein LOC5507878 [Nematostella vectensis]|uniref:uncharacterized protein LOC5507878 n=1 Tax=Nematostella vectensis TaxID=45351 RepID=UPI002076F326|nr:uncharacterized protein LOC5507878 [Nematostella vectensis]